MCLAAVHELEGLEDLDGLPPLDTQGAAPVPELLPLVSTNRRQDLRGVPFVTIDGRTPGISMTRCMPHRSGTGDPWHGNSGWPSRT